MLEELVIVRLGVEGREHASVPGSKLGALLGGLGDGGGSSEGG